MCNPFTVEYDKLNWYAYFEGRKYQFRTLAEAKSFLIHADNYSAAGLLAQFAAFELTPEERERFAVTESDMDADRRAACDSQSHWSHQMKRQFILSAIERHAASSFTPDAIAYALRFSGLRITRYDVIEVMGASEVVQ